MRILSTRLRSSLFPGKNDDSSVASVAAVKGQSKDFSRITEENNPLAGPISTSVGSLQNKKRLQVEFAIQCLSLSVYRESEYVNLHTCSPMVSILYFFSIREMLKILYRFSFVLRECTSI